MCPGSLGFSPNRAERQDRFNLHLNTLEKYTPSSLIRLVLSNFEKIKGAHCNINITQCGDETTAESYY